MKVTGIIAEYNPFHKGHAYQLKLSKKDCDAIVVVMSASFVQRGDVAIFDKWSRAKMALTFGADLVLELPVAFSMNTAERFAFGGVSILDQLNVIDSLCFGSESGEISILFDAAKKLEAESDLISDSISSFLAAGEGFAKAREKAFSKIIDPALLSTPNNILGIEYIRQLIRRNSKIVPITHKREGSDYHNTALNCEFPSATAIRNAVLTKKFLYEPFKNSPVHRLENLDTAVLYNIRKNKEDAFFNICDVSEGIENRIIKASKEVFTMNELVDKVSTKRYTKSRIRRVILSSFLGLDKSLSKTEPDYIRVLGATPVGFELLNQIKKNSTLKIITKTADFKEENPSFAKDILATDIYDLASASPSGAGMDFKKSPIIYGGNNE